MTEILPLIISILTAVAQDVPLIEELVKLLEGPFNGSRAPTAAEWEQLNALAATARARFSDV